MTKAHPEGLPEGAITIDCVGSGGQSFGEMGLLEKAPRSATAVALEEETSVAVVTEAGFGEYFEQNPSKVLMVMQQMSHNLRRRTDEFIRVCRSIRELSEKEGEK